MSGKTEPIFEGIAPYLTMQCLYKTQHFQCTENATWHIIWDKENHSICCDTHMDNAEKLTYYDKHPITQVCTMPDTITVWSWDKAPGYCSWNVEKETLEAL